MTHVVLVSWFSEVLKFDASEQLELWATGIVVVFDDGPPVVLLDN